MIKVYAAAGTRSCRVLWALEELGAPYEVVALKFPPRVHHPDFLAISPAGALPAIQDGDATLIESLAIGEYLNRKFGGDLVVARRKRVTSTTSSSCISGSRPLPRHLPGRVDSGLGWTLRCRKAGKLSPSASG
jgi:hypothetical protein